MLKKSIVSLKELLKTNIFSKINVLAKALNTRKEVDTGTPTFVNNNKQIGAIKYLYLKVIG